MSLLLALKDAPTLEAFDPAVRAELQDTLIPAMQAALALRTTGAPVGMLLTLRYKELLPPIVSDELEQLLAALQVQLSASIYKSAPQIVSIAAGGVAPITTVNTSYARLTILGWKSTNTTGGVSADRFKVVFDSPTQISAVGRGTSNVLVEEFYPGAFYQAFIHGDLTIPLGGTSVSQSVGVTLGPKAFVAPRGEFSNRQPDLVTPLALTEAQVTTTLALSGTTLSASCVSAPYAAPSDGTIVVGYTVIDPR